jgi:hypothetical protein
MQQQAQRPRFDEQLNEPPLPHDNINPYAATLRQIPLRCLVAYTATLFKDERIVLARTRCRTYCIRIAEEEDCVALRDRQGRRLRSQYIDMVLNQNPQ